MNQIRLFTKSLPKIVKNFFKLFFVCFYFASYLLMINLLQNLKPQVCGFKIDVDRRNSNAKHGAKNGVILNFKFLKF